MSDKIEAQLTVQDVKLDNIIETLERQDKKIDLHIAESVSVRDETIKNTTKVGFLMKGFWTIVTIVTGTVAWIIRTAVAK